MIPQSCTELERVTAILTSEWSVIQVNSLVFLHNLKWRSISFHIHTSGRFVIDTKMIWMCDLKFRCTALLSPITKSYHSNFGVNGRISYGVRAPSFSPKDCSFVAYTQPIAIVQFGIYFLVIKAHIHL